LNGATGYLNGRPVVGANRDKIGILGNKLSEQKPVETINRVSYFYSPQLHQSPLFFLSEGCLCSLSALKLKKNFIEQCFHAL
jgi:hypothetical protein